MIFKQWCRRSGGGDNPFNHGIYYHYFFAERFRDRFASYKATVRIDKSEFSEIGRWTDPKSLRVILKEGRWSNNDQRIIPWLKTNTKGKVKFIVAKESSFFGDLTESNTGRRPEDENAYYEVKFSDKGVAMLFKLIFGGK